jgi:hypothetical protein
MREKCVVMSSKYVRSVFVFTLIFTIIFGTIEFSRTGQFSVTSIILNFIGGLSIGFVLGFISSQFPFRNGIRIAVLWLALFVIQYLSNFVEYYFFSTVSVSIILSGLGEGLVVTFIEAVFIGLLFVPVKMDSSIGVEMKKFFEQRSGSSWFWRIVVASILYIPIYLAFGLIVTPLVTPYYTDPSFGLDLVIPSFEVILPLQFVRGLIYVLVMLPFIATLKIGRKYLFVAITLLLFIPGGFIPLLTNQMWPVLLRVFHGIEILGDYIVFAAVIVRLLKKKD